MKRKDKRFLISVICLILETIACAACFVAWGIEKKIILCVCVSFVMLYVVGQLAVTNGILYAHEILEMRKKETEAKDK